MKIQPILLTISFLLMPCLTQAQSVTLGSCTTHNGGDYNGEIAKGLPNGKVKTTWKNGNWYEDEYVKGKRQGNGTCVFANREHFEAIQGFHAGVKKSGIGGADGKHGVDEYLVTHVTYLDTYDDM